MPPSSPDSSSACKRPRMASFTSETLSVLGNAADCPHGDLSTSANHSSLTGSSSHSLPWHSFTGPSDQPLPSTSSKRTPFTEIQQSVSLECSFNCSPPLSPSNCQVQSFPSPLLPGLPDDLAIMCLARLPRTLLLPLQIVSKSWKHALADPHLHSIRAQLGLSEEWLYVETWNWKSKRMSWLVFDHAQGKWRCLPPVPRKRGFSAEIFGRASAVLRGHLLVVGGKAGFSGPTLRDVFAYSPISNKWSRRKSMIDTRHSPLFSVLRGKLYVLEGFDCFNQALHSSECYDFELDEWQKVNSEGHPKLSAPEWFHRGWTPQCLSITLAIDRLYCCYREEHSQGYIKLYDPVAGKWHLRSRKTKAIVRYGLNTVLGGKLYTVDWATGRVRVADVSGVGWINLTGLSLKEVPWVSILIANPRMVGLGSQLFVVRRGLHVVIIELNDEKRRKGASVYYELLAGRGAEDEEVIACQVLAA